MSDLSIHERFQFDTQGFIVLRGVLAADACASLLAKVRELEAAEHDDAWRHTPRIGGTGSPILEKPRDTYRRLNGLPRLDPIFDEVFAHPQIIQRLRAFMNQPQLVNTWSISKWKGETWGGWHRGVPQTGYNYHNGQIRTIMLNTIWMLTDNGPDDGIVHVIPGSHKSNLEIDLWSEYPADKAPGAIPVTGKAGDVILFSEALLHNGGVKSTDGIRTNLYLNYIESTYNPVMREMIADNLGCVHHYWFDPSIRERFNDEQKALTAWMAWLDWNAIERPEAAPAGGV